MKNRIVDLKKLKFRVKRIMRYDDVGDYYENNIISYDMGDEILNNAIFIHEFIEYMLIQSAGIPSKLIDKFDNDPSAPDKYPEEYRLYSKFHNMANVIERQFIKNLGFDWKNHQKRIYTVPVKTLIEETNAKIKQKKLIQRKKIQLIKTNGVKMGKKTVKRKK